MTEHYFQFPISALSFGLNKESGWYALLDWACWEYGIKVLVNTPDHIVIAEVNAYLAQHKECSANPKLPAHRALVLGLARLHVRASGTIHKRLENAQEVRTHCAAAPYPLVRIRADIWWKAFTPESSDAPISFREFVVLCAVYAGIGSKPYAKLSHKYLRCLASGFPKWKDFISKQKESSSKSLFLSARQIRTTLDALEANGFFAKFTYNRGECFYSHKLKRSELVTMIEKRKLRKLETVASYRSLDQATSKSIRARKEAAAAPLRLMA